MASARGRRWAAGQQRSWRCSAATRWARPRRQRRWRTRSPDGAPSCSPAVTAPAATWSRTARSPVPGGRPAKAGPPPGSGCRRRTPGAQADASALVLRPRIGHRRNYVEAHLCDVAVAFDGAPGTTSEVAFRLALGRPVVLVGRRLGRDVPPPAGPARQLPDAGPVAGAGPGEQHGRRRPGSPRGLRGSGRGPPSGFAPHRLPRLPADGDLEAVVDDALRLAADARPGRDPDLPGHARARAVLERWLDDVAYRLGTP